jgi:hypothetical protein
MSVFGKPRQASDWRTLYFTDPNYSVKAAEETIRQLGETAMYGKSSTKQQRNISQGSGEVMKGSKRTAEIEVSAFHHALDIGKNFDKVYNPRKQMAVWMAAARAAEGGGKQRESGEWYTGAGGTPTWGYLTGEQKGAKNIQSGYNPPEGMFTPKETDLWKFARQQYGFTGKGSTNANLRQQNIGGHKHSDRVKDMIASGKINNDWISAWSERRTPTEGERLTKAEKAKNKHFAAEFKKHGESIIKSQREYDLWKAWHMEIAPALPW